MDNLNDGKFDWLRRRVPTRRNPTDGGVRSPASAVASSNVLLEGGRRQSGSPSSSPNDRPRLSDEFSFLLSTLQSASPEQRRLLSEILRTGSSDAPSEQMDTLASMQKAMSSLSTSHAKDNVPSYNGDPKETYKFIRQLRLHHERWFAPQGTTRLWLLSKFKVSTTSWAEKVLSKTSFPSCEQFCDQIE